MMSVTLTPDDGTEHVENRKLRNQSMDDDDNEIQDLTAGVTVVRDVDRSRWKRECVVG
jgi:hypothetical protein